MMVRGTPLTNERLISLLRSLVLGVGGRVSCARLLRLLLVLIFCTQILCSLLVLSLCSGRVCGSCARLLCSFFFSVALAALSPLPSLPPSFSCALVCSPVLPCALLCSLVPTGAPLRSGTQGTQRQRPQNDSVSLVFSLVLCEEPPNDAYLAALAALSLAPSLPPSFSCALLCPGVLY